MTREEPNPPTPFPGKEGGEIPSESVNVEGSAGGNARPSPPSFLGKGAGGLGSSRRKIALGLAVVLGAFGLWYFVIREPEPKDDLGRFQGQWQLAVPALDREGKPGARPTPVTIRVAGDRWVLTANGQERGRYAVTLRPEANPKEIDLVQLGPDDKPTGQRSRGVYTIERGRAKVVHTPEPDPRPTDLDTEDGTVWLLERVK